MSEMTDKKKVYHISTVTEKFCSRLGRNTVIVVTKTVEGETKKCLYADECVYKNDCYGKTV